MKKHQVLVLLSAICLCSYAQMQIGSAPEKQTYTHTAEHSGECCPSKSVEKSMEQIAPTAGSDWIAVKVPGVSCNGYAGSLCSCRTYIGYRLAGTDYYRGSCSNYAGGHRCGHTPKAHGLREG